MTKDDKNKEGEYSTAEISEDEHRYLEQTALLGLEYVLSDFAKQFQKSARRWELMAYPAMLVFGLLAISGFWLIYSLTKDMNRMSDAIDPNMGPNLSKMSRNISELDASIRDMNNHITQMTANVQKMESTLITMNDTLTIMGKDISNMGPLLFNIAEMNQSMKHMTMSTGIMSRDMNKVSRPWRKIDDFLP